MSSPKEDPIKIAPWIPRGPIVLTQNHVQHKWTPDTIVTKTDGTATSIAALSEGKNLIIQFFYTRCNGTCPGTTMNLRKILAMMSPELRKDTVVISVSLDPERDTLGELKSYSDARNLPKNWHVVKASRPNLEHLLKVTGMSADTVDPKTQKIKHTAQILFGSKRSGHWRMVNADKSDTRVALEILQITFEGIKYRNPRVPGKRLIPGQKVKVG
jgi:cytochrome oxidase Cu insertion factor (SCO1/SenC/PrrC family)